MAKDFGVANYTARKVSEGLVLVIADGTAPYVNTRVTLEQLSWRIWPPRIGLYFDTPALHCRPCGRSSSPVSSSIP
jgi:hypothetical protein